MSVPKKRPTVMQLARNKRGTRFFVQWQRGIGFITWQVTGVGESFLVGQMCVIAGTETNGVNHGRSAACCALLR